MKFKIIIASILFISVFGFYQTAFAMTDAERAALIVQLQAQIVQLQQQLQRLVASTAVSPQNNVSTETGSSWCHTFNKNMVKGDTGSEVSALQTALAKHGYDVSADAAGVYGVATFNAVVKFQEKYASEILTPFGLFKGTGAVYAKTRVKLNYFYTCYTESDLTDITDDGAFSITITSPTNRQKISGGDVLNINWTSTGASAETLDIFLTDYSSTPVSTVIKTGVLVSSGTYAWTVPTDLSGNNYKILLSVTAKNAQAKSHPFSIVSSTLVNFTSPVENAKWYIGEKYTMTWRLPESHEYQTVNVSLVDSAGIKTPIASKYTTGHNSKVGNYIWTVPSTITAGNYKLYVEGSACSSTVTSYSLDCDDFTAYSDIFVIAAITTSQPTIKVLTPATDATLKTYLTYNITWEQQNLEGYKVDISATSTQGREQIIATGVDASLGTYAYSIPPAMGGGQVWRIKVASNFTTTFSQVKTGTGYTVAYTGQFKVNHGKKIKVEAPNGGQTLNYDTTYYIRWITGNVTTTNIYLVNAVTNTQYTIAVNIPSATTDFIYSYAFKPTATYPQGNYKILVVDSSDTTIKDYSDSSFAIGSTITEPITCTENWSCGGWSACLNNQKTKTCVDLNGCGTTANKPATIESCTSITCTPSWTCEWSQCINGYMSKVVVDKNNCGLPASSSGTVCTTEVTACTNTGSSATVGYPNGNEQIYRGRAYNITWTQTGLSKINIFLKNDTNGLLYTIATDITASLGTYRWTLSSGWDALPVGNKYKILLGYGDKNDYSDNYFSIGAEDTPSITVSSPNGGEQWHHGSSYNITWNSSNLNTVNIFAKNISTGVMATIAGNVTASNGTYSWTIPPTATAQTYRLGAGQYKIVVSGTSSTNGIFVEDTSDSSFDILDQVSTKSVTVVSPNGGETLTQGISSTISWKTSGVAGYNLSVYLKNIDTGTLYAIKTNSTAETTSSYVWEVPSTVPAGNRYKVRVIAWDGTGNNVEDFSDNYVTVVSGVQHYIKINSPNGGEQLTVGVPYTITWETNYSSPTTNTVNIYLAMAGALNETTIATNIPVSAGSYTWRPQWTGNAKIRIQYVALIDYSDSSFTVSQSTVKSLSLVSPNGGELWYKDTQYSITWSSANISTVNLYLENSWNGQRYTIATGVSAANHLYYWKIPTTYTNDTYKVLIVDAADTTLKDYSNTAFSIVSRAVNPGIDLLLPNGGESLKSGDVYNITWNTSALANTSKIRIYLFDENVQPSKMYILVTDLPYTAKSYSWTIGSNLPAGEKYKIQLQVYRTFSSGAEEGFANDVGAYFSINTTPTTPMIEVRTPPSNIILFPGDNCTTTWTSKNVDKVTIRLVDSIYYPGYKTDEAKVYATISDVSASAGTYTFKIPNTIDFGAYALPKEVKVWISDQSSLTVGSSGFFYLNKTRP